jgi:hypothetical protein
MALSSRLPGLMGLSRSSVNGGAIPTTAAIVTTTASNWPPARASGSGVPPRCVPIALPAGFGVERYHAGGTGHLEIVMADLQATLTSREQDEHAVAVLIGVPPADFSLAPLTDYAFSTPPAPLVLPSQLLERRPDVVTAERTAAAAANARIGVAVAAFYPALNLSVEESFESTAIGSYSADSSGRRNIVVMPMAEEPVESFSWSFPTKGLAWSCVDRVSDAIKLITRVSAEVCAFREVLSKQAIGVLGVPRCQGL